MNFIFKNKSEFNFPRKFLQDWLFAVESFCHKKKTNIEIVLVFLKSNEAKKINRQFRGKSYATDVLSFESEDLSNYGELIFCPAVIKENAKRHKVSYREELAYVALHGFLHLLGYDHETSLVDEKKMFALQDKIYNELVPSFNFIKKII